MLGQELARETIHHRGNVINTGEPVYQMFDDTPDSKTKFTECITKANHNDFGIICVNLVSKSDPNDVMMHFLAMWRRGDFWYITGGERGGMLFRVASGVSGQGIIDLLFTPGGRDCLCAPVGEVFGEERVCTWNNVLFPRIQLRPPEMWNEETAEEIVYHMPWPITEADVSVGGKAHSIHIIRDGDGQFIEELHYI